jgi:hypothetical protein
MDEWIQNLDPQLMDAYDLPIQINLSELDKEDIHPLRSVMNRLYEVAKQFDFRIVFANLSENIQTVTEGQTCHHMMASCQHKRTGAEDIIQKLVAIANQTKNNTRKVQVILR